MKMHLIVASTLLLSACSQSVAPVPAAAASKPEFDVVSLDRSACFGTCPVYSVEIRADGNAVFAGAEHVKTPGRHNSKLSQSELALLSSALREVKLETMRDQYVTAEDGCVNLPTDHPSFSVSVKQSGTTKTVVFYTGCHGPTVPSAALFWLASTIDFVSKTSKLIE
jgi:hypothetical protein